MPKIATLGELWVGLPGLGFRAGRRLGELGELLGPIAALRLIGCSEGFSKQLELHKSVAFCYHNFSIPQLWTGNDRTKTEGHLDRLGGRLNYCYERALEAEKILRVKGWRFNAETKKLLRIARHKGRDLLAECVWKIYSEKFREKGNTFPVRRKIAAYLGPYFECDELKKASGGPTYTAIYNREKRSR
jgi:hypothetical protein